MNRERESHVWNGWLMSAVNIALFFLAAGLLVAYILSAVEAEKTRQVPNFYLLVVLCGEAEAQPVINTGTLYA